MRTFRILTLSLVVSALALVVVACGGVDSGGNNAGGVADTGGAADAAVGAATARQPAEKLVGQQITAALAIEGVFILDVRGADELPEQGAIEGYTLIPIGELADRLDELPRDRPILTL